jgi:hypothetical protein
MATPTAAGCRPCVDDCVPVDRRPACRPPEIVVGAAASRHRRVFRPVVGHARRLQRRPTRSARCRRLLVPCAHAIDSSKAVQQQNPHLLHTGRPARPNRSRCVDRERHRQRERQS